MTVKAYVAHSTSGRLRLRAPEMRKEEEFFSRVSEYVSSLKGVETVQVNPTTASILLEYRDLSLADLTAELCASGLLDVIEDTHREPRTLLDRASEGFQTLDEGLLLFTKGSVDAATVMFLTLIAAALSQLARGQVFPTSTLVWHLYDLMSRHRGPTSTD